MSRTFYEEAERRARFEEALAERVKGWNIAEAPMKYVFFFPEYPEYTRDAVEYFRKRIWKEHMSVDEPGKIEGCVTIRYSDPDAEKLIFKEEYLRFLHNHISEAYKLVSWWITRKYILDNKKLLQRSSHGSFCMRFVDPINTVSRDFLKGHICTLLENEFGMPVGGSVYMQDNRAELTGFTWHTPPPKVKEEGKVEQKKEERCTVS